MVTSRQVVEEYSDKLGKKVLLRKKSAADWVIVGQLQKILGTKLIIQGNDDCHTIDYDDILSLDIKGREKFETK